MAAMIRQLLDFSRHRAPRLGLASARDRLRRTDRHADGRSRRPRRHHASRPSSATIPLLVSADEHQMQQALVNLIVNAMQAMPDGGRIEVTTGERRVHPPGEHGSERDFVRHRGRRPRIRDPARAPAAPLRALLHHQGPGEGRGLGLSVAHGIVRDHGGWIDRRERRSATAVASRSWLPAVASAARRRPTVPHERPDPTRPRPGRRRRAEHVRDARRASAAARLRRRPGGRPAPRRWPPSPTPSTTPSSPTSTCARWTASSSATASCGPIPRCRSSSSPPSATSTPRSTPCARAPTTS